MLFAGRVDPYDRRMWPGTLRQVQHRRLDGPLAGEVDVDLLVIPGVHGIAEGRRGRVAPGARRVVDGLSTRREQDRGHDADRRTPHQHGSAPHFPPSPSSMVPRADPGSHAKAAPGKMAGWPPADGPD